MDTAAYLRKHGWQGTGHALDATKTHAIKRPLLVSKKVDVLGLGTNKHANITDQWWLKALDSSLKDLGTDKQSLLSTVRKHGIKQGGLYGRFVSGGVTGGTIGEPQAEMSTDTAQTTVDAPKDKMDQDYISLGVDDTKTKKASKRKAETDAKGDAKRLRTVDKATPVLSYAKLDKRAKVQERKTLRKQMAQMDEEKKARYTERAAERKMTLEQYCLNRMRKNNAAQAAASIGPDSKVHAERLAAMEMTIPPTSTPMTVSEIKKLSACAQVDVINPQSWEGKVIKYIPKDLRKIRRLWMQARRTIRHDKDVAAGVKKPKALPRDKRRSIKRAGVTKLRGKNGEVSDGAAAGTISAPKKKKKKLAKSKSNGAETPRKGKQGKKADVTAKRFASKDKKSRKKEKTAAA